MSTDLKDQSKLEHNPQENKTNAIHLQNSNHSTPDECIIYWDFDSSPITNGQQLRNITNGLTQKINNKIGSKPIQFRIYSCINKIPRKLQDDFSINGIEHIITSSTIIDSANKRIIIDISLKLYELEKYKKSNCIALISNNNTFAHLLSRIHNEPPISHTLLISLNPNTQINPNLANNVDFIITHSIINNGKRLNRDYDHNTNTNNLPPPIAKKQKINHKPINIIFTDTETNKHIIMQIPSGQKFKTTIRKLKTQIEKTIKPPHKILTKIQLLYNGNILAPNYAINHYMISNNDTIHFDCTWKQTRKNDSESDDNGDDSLRLIKVREFGANNSINIAVDPTWKIKQFRKHIMKDRDFKLCLKNKYGIMDDSNCFSLIFKENVLGNKKMIKKCGICEGDTVIWYLKDVHSIQLTVKVANSVSYCNVFNVNVSKTIHNIIAEIKSKVPNGNSVKAKNISLWWKGCELRLKNQNIMQYGICNGDVIVFVLGKKIENKTRAKDMSMENMNNVKGEVKRTDTVIRYEKHGNFIKKNVDIVHVGKSDREICDVLYGDNMNNTNNSKKCDIENEDSDIEIIENPVKKEVNGNRKNDVDIKIKMPDLENGSDRE